MWTARTFVSEKDETVHQVWDGWNWANCVSRELADKIAMALNFQESQLTKGQYPPVEGKQ